MRSSRFLVRKFRSAALERAFRLDYARRYAGQRRLASTLFTLTWIAFSIRDYWWRMDILDPNHIHHIGYVRLAGAVGMAAAVWLMWGARALDERWAVGLHCLWTLSCWFALLWMLVIYPRTLAVPEIFPVLYLTVFMIFTAFRLRAITAAWLVGICFVTFHLTLYLQPLDNAEPQWFFWLTRGSIVLMMSIVGIIVSIQIERSARREFVFRRTLRAAKARVETTSRVVKQQNERMKELIK
ncbi:hypothetical protein, partial [Paraburkholderia sediminicola]|uniref:hypothetical protein n=1 Tax=Paraburkholderia sediminicola TaxID=458836 RepID=UPI0038BD6178